MAVDLKRVPRGERAAVRKLTRQSEAMPSKYRNRRCQSRDGHTFASKRERDRYEELAMLEAAGAVQQLTLQPRYKLVLNGVKLGTYVADFTYWQGDHPVTEDVKGHRTREYLLKKALLKALYDIEVRET